MLAAVGSPLDVFFEEKSRRSEGGGAPNSDFDSAMPQLRHQLRKAMQPRSLEVGSRYLRGFGLVASAANSVSCSQTSVSTKRLDKECLSQMGKALNGKWSLREVMKRRLLPRSTGTHNMNMPEREKRHVTYNTHVKYLHV